ncbi:unnamed protein product [Coffea canephora]|uniref:FAS1 domain-containing protein n=1 Tax=Coffea canephora TaxID=49390 RepID=A0A068UZT5_COFCA|nr:unnamed protein product [Coffea canephora]
MKARRGQFPKNQVAFVCAILCVSCALVLFVSVFRLPDVTIASFRPENRRAVGRYEKIGKFGEMVIEMLPEDLPFTVFLPSEKAFERDLRLHLNDSLVGDKANDTYAILTRVLGFSAVPRMINSVNVPYGQEVDFDSLAGFTLYISRGADGVLVVNRIRSNNNVGLQQRSKILVHIMDGVIMDAEFEQSVLPDYNEDGGGG